MCIKLPIVNGQQWVIHTKALKTIWIKTMLFIASIVYLIPSRSVDGKVKEKKSSCSKTVLNTQTLEARQYHPLFF